MNKKEIRVGNLKELQEAIDVLPFYPPDTYIVAQQTITLGTRQSIDGHGATIVFREEERMEEKLRQ